MRYSLSPTMAQLLEMLALNQAVTAHAMREQLGDTTAVKVHVHRMRKRLEKFGIMVNSQYGIGYWMSKEDRERVLEDMKPDQLELPLVGGGDGVSSAV